MSDVSSEQRQRAKAAAANAAVAANDTAVVLGVAAVAVAGAGAATGVGAPAGIFAGGALAIGSFAAWAIGNRYQRLANDPPRDDFGEVSVTGGSVSVESLPTEEPQSSVARFAAQQIVLADALSLLVTSLERYDGAVAVGDADSAVTQANAVRDNSWVALACQSELATLAPAINDAWTAARGEVSWGSLTISDAQDAFSGLAQPGSEGMNVVLNGVTGLTDPDTLTDDLEQHPLLTAGELPEEPEQLVDDSFLAQLAELTDSLGQLVVD